MLPLETACVVATAAVHASPRALASELYYRAPMLRMAGRAPFVFGGCCLLLGVLVSATGCCRRKKPSPSTLSSGPRARRAYALDDYAALCASTSAAPFDGVEPRKSENGTPLARGTRVFVKWTDDKAPAFRAFHTEGLEGVLAGPGEVNAVELVACVERKREGTPLRCSFYGATLEIYDMRDTLRIVEAKTGKELSREEFQLDGKTNLCPASYSFPKGVTSVYVGAELGPKILSSLLPFQPPDVAFVGAKVGRLETVCSGSPVPQAPAYDPASTAPRKVNVVYFPTPTSSFRSEDWPKGLGKAERFGDVALHSAVACVTGKPNKKKKSCPYIGGKTLELHDGEVELSLVETRTAKVLETKTFRATSPGGCPSSHAFGNGYQRMLQVEPAFATYLAGLQRP